MSCCSHCLGADKMFDQKTAKRDLKRYQKKGPDKSTLLLLDAIKNLNPEGMTLLDIGGGIGTISFELFKCELSASTQVDASTGYLELSRQEAEKRGLSNRMKYVYGDFTDIASNFKPADIVTLDRVVCCYPDMEKLIEKSINKAGKIYGLVYPRDHFITRIAISLGNLWFKLRKNDFRSYLHSPDKINREIRNHGFTRVSVSRTIIWEVVIYES